MANKRRKSPGSGSTAIELGAVARRGTELITLFVPSVDRDSRPIDQAHWVNEALAVLGSQFGGATAFPPGKGVWRDDERGGSLVREEVAIVVSYANPDSLTPATVSFLREFLHRMGREARQGEVGVVISGEYHGIQRYDGDESSEP